MEEDKLVITDDISNEEIKNLIYTIRGKQVMLDSDVAMLYHYETKNVNKAVKRNIDRFPEDFCFQLTKNEFQTLWFQFGTSKQNKELNDELRGGRRYLPYAFTEQGIAMLSGVLKNDIAIEVSINIMRAFTEMRKFLMLNGQMFERLINVEYKLLEHDKKFDEVLNSLQSDENINQRIFFEGQIYDAYTFFISYEMYHNNSIFLHFSILPLKFIQNSYIILQKDTREFVTVCD